MEEKKNTFQNIKRRGVLAVPSLFTIGNMACGFFSILASVNGNFHKAGWLILIALLLDGLDGRVARMLNAETDFGVEMDSLADLATFCAAPAFLVYFMALNKYALFGAPIAFFYMLCGGLRLAKFNTMAKAGTGSKKYFSGLPTPAAAAILAAFAISYSIFIDVNVSGQNIIYLEHILPFIYNSTAFIVVFLGLLMVSKIPYAAFKDKKERRRRGIPFMLLIAVIIFLLIKYPQNVVFIVFSLYVIVGLLAVLLRAFKRIEEK
ncbi:CDP-diacylglycerol--serine O-phosphatidyltransferase [Elusimicrobium posterum]|uniref:CDP-diacylglycerol--serine O-phosphatidyltransferase n=1 Tax=Elusimicrobium posterum TaxID=3116653 RepID=UPI003C724473